MKAVLCGVCLDFRALDPSCNWTYCRCGNVSARWEDPDRGTVKVRASDRSKARILGMNNRFLVQGTLGLPTDLIKQEGGTNAAWRKLHDEATTAPGYIFDKGHRGCWACIFQVGETNDVTWDEARPTLE